jgi:DNA-binding NarL/FixJ family response regulator
VLDNEQRRLHIHREKAIEIILGDLIHSTVDNLPGIIDENVQPIGMLYAEPFSVTGVRAGAEEKMAARYPRPDVPVIMITAYGDPDTKRKAIEGGAEGLLIKPIDFTLLREEIDTRLEPAV